MKTTGTCRACAIDDPEAGLGLVAVVVMCFIVLLLLSAAAPVVARGLQREKEQASIDDAHEIDRAIRVYYRKNKSYPPSWDALQNTNNVRYLRQKYADPLTGKPDWRVIHPGQNQTQVTVFFGEPLAGINGTGIGGGTGATTTTTPGTAATTIGQTNGLAAGFGGATIGGSAGTTSTDSKSGDDSGSSGGPIMGVGTARTGSSIATPADQSTYETWEFLYDPRIEQLYAQSNILGGGGGASSQSASSFGKDAVSGQSNSSGSGGSSGSGSGGGSGTSGSGGRSTPQ